LNYGKLLLSILMPLIFALPAPARSTIPPAVSHDVFQTTGRNQHHRFGGEMLTTAAEAMAQRFSGRRLFPEGDMHVFGPNDRKKNLVVRLHGSGKHRPVSADRPSGFVEARREDWTDGSVPVRRKRRVLLRPAAPRT